MDIDLLAKMVKEAILDYDAVTLPGVGSFVAELMPSTFSDKGYTINPPYRRLYFSPRQGSDTLLADLYARDNQGVTPEMATRILQEFLAEMKEVLKLKKTVVFPGLGRLRATRENHIFFVADEDLDIYPEGLGLAPISLKTHVETPEEVASAVAGLAELMGEEIPDQVGNDGGQQEIPGQAGNDAKEEEIPDQAGNDAKEEEIPGQAGNDAKEEEIPGQAGNDEKVGNDEPEVIEPRSAAKKSRKWLWVMLIVLGVILVLVAGYVLVGRLAPEWLDPLLYNEEELEILRY
jgi:nucleoid DNA-binding protein